MKTLLISSVAAWCIAIATEQNLKAESGAIPSVPPASGKAISSLSNLVFDAETKECQVQPGEKQGKFTFHVTNNSDNPVVINSITGSCGCTKAKMPQTPWIIAPHAKVDLQATMDLSGKPPGKTTKTLTLTASDGTRQIFVSSIIPEPPATAGQKG